MDDDGLTWDRNRERRERLWGKGAAAPGPDHTNPEPTRQDAAGSAVPADHAGADPLAEAHATLGERIAARKRNPTAGPRWPTLAERVAARSRRRADQEALDQRRAEDDATLAEHPRPRTRADCEDGERPCPWVSCRHHLYLDVNPETGLLKLQKREPWDLEHSCALDLAEREGMGQPEIAEVLGVTRQRVEQLQTRGLKLLKMRGVDLR